MAGILATGLFASTFFIPPTLLAYYVGWFPAAMYIIGWPVGVIFMTIRVSHQSQGVRVKSLRETLQTICLWPLA